MNIREEIGSELWDAVKKEYENEDFTGAIRDATLKLTDIIRNKAGLDGDGVKIVGQAFGGDNPLIKLNKLQTDSEKDIQRGMQDILRGIYIGIRNPRMHEANKDIKESADAILLFINYILGLIDNSRLRFEKEEFLKRVFDQHYVKTKEYSDLLVKDIPERRRTDFAIEVMHRRGEGEIYALGFFMDSLLDSLNDLDRERVYAALSDELRVNDDYSDIRLLIHAFPGKYWSLIEESVRLRTEAILLQDFKNAVFNPDTQDCISSGWLATWVTKDHLMNFQNRPSWESTATLWLGSEDTHKVAYLDQYFWYNICEINRDNIGLILKWYFRAGLNNNDEAVIERLKDQILYDENHPWWTVFEEELKLHPDIVPAVKY